MAEERKGVFGSVDQRAMFERLAQAPEDDADAVFIEQGDNANPIVLAGIRALADTEVAAQEPAKATAIAGVSEPIVVRGRLADDPTAAAAFVCYGPAAVQRP